VVPARGVEGADLHGGGAEQQHGYGAGYVLPEAENEGVVDYESYVESRLPLTDFITRPIIGHGS